jgi:hypothetical protein
MAFPEAISAVRIKAPFDSLGQTFRNAIGPGLASLGLSSLVAIGRLFDRPFGL